MFEWISHSEIRELRMRRFSREAQGTRSLIENEWSGKSSGRLSFGYFSLAEQRKVPRRRAREPASNKNRACKALLQWHRRNVRPASRKLTVRIADAIRSYRLAEQRKEKCLGHGGGESRWHKREGISPVWAKPGYLDYWRLIQVTIKKPGLDQPGLSCRYNGAQ